MRLTLVGDVDASPLGRQWHAAIAPLIVRHPNRVSVILLTLTAGAEPELTYAVDATTDSTDPTRMMRSPFIIGTIKLTYFPGVHAAQAFIVAMHAGYLLHESFELVTIGDLSTRVLDPHAPVEATNPWNRGVRDGQPSVLTRETLFRALLVVMSAEAATSLM